MMGVTDRFTRFIAALGVQDASMTGRRWFGRGLLRFTALPGIGTDDSEVAAIWCHGYSEGADDALRLAGIVLSDPVCRGREREALKLLSEGLDHGSIIAALRVSKPASAQDNVFNLADRRGG
ncbi:hypothetical protein [Agrobacterium larrymoorei]|uniref:Uncharacterized protein n=1 Tax=Agrobacterium larrymoorei TaxID=160699 RepID=A0ABU0UIF4_9HYPH|nr:hypothetical protein [Agrobacterium larrymoorei]MDQ1184701.1 hypothetical protein [Agrobacterium larrymoorei]